MHKPQATAAAKQNGLRTSAEVLALVVLGAIAGAISIVPVGASLNEVLFACAIVAVVPVPSFCKVPRGHGALRSLKNQERT
jgi:hypothetical protein